MKKNTTQNTTYQTPGLWGKIKSVFKNETLSFLIGLFLVIFAVYMLLAMASFFSTGEADQSILENERVDLLSTDNGVRNYAGSKGAELSNYLINKSFGVSSVFIVVFTAMAGLKLMRVRKVRLWKWFLGCSILLIWFSIFLGFALMDQYQDSFFYLGGMHGYNISRWLVSQIGVPGTWMLLLITALCFFIYLSARTVIWLRSLLTLSFLRKNRPEAKSGDVPEEFTDSWEVKKNTPNGHSDARNEAAAHPTEEEVAGDYLGKEFDMVVESNTGADEDPLVHPDGLKGEEEANLSEDLDNDNSLAFDVESHEEEEYVGEGLEPYNPQLDLENYRFPPIDLLRQFDNDEPTINMEEQNANKDKIVSTLRSFGIEISSIKATVGPTVTLYEITPAQGIRINKIRGLEDDIAMSLSALGIRIIAPIPGKGTIGIEVPNEHAKIVSGRSILNSRKFQESKFDLPVAIGKTITNEVFMFDLCKMPHVLVAGATGQGKSVGLNAIIASLLYKKHPSELKFVLIDPKKVEFSVYSTIEHHFLAELPDSVEPIVTDEKLVVKTLNSLCKEMDSRYDLLKLAKVRNIKEYNEKFINRRLNPEKGHHFLAYIVVVIDEFGDLILTAGKDIELPITRIAQKARAIGIHMIIATQRPTTSIITGNIKANFPARIAFRTSQRIDSTIILDRPGANQLIGKGDLLFLQGADPVRVQCAFIDTPEIMDIVNYISKQQGYVQPYYLPEPDEEAGAEGGGSDVDMEKLDPMFEEAAELIVASQSGSTSLIQRKFSIGYNRAGRIMDQLERAGIVGPAQGSKPREVQCSDLADLQFRIKNLKNQF